MSDYDVPILLPQVEISILNIYNAINDIIELKTYVNVCITPTTYLVPLILIQLHGMKKYL